MSDQLTNILNQAAKLSLTDREELIRGLIDLRDELPIIYLTTEDDTDPTSSDDDYQPWHVSTEQDIARAIRESVSSGQPKVIPPHYFSNLKDGLNRDYGTV